MTEDQEIVALNNITKKIIELDLSLLNLNIEQDWHDLLSDNRFTNEAVIVLHPYESIWLTNVT